MSSPKGPQRLRAQSQGCRSEAGSTLEIYNAARAPSISGSSTACSAFETFFLSRWLDHNSAQLHNFWIPASENIPKAKLSGFSRVLQALHNQLMHAYNGNPPTIQLEGNLCSRIQLQLYDLLYSPACSTQTFRESTLPPRLLSLSQLLPVQENVYSRDSMLRLRSMNQSNGVGFGFSTQTTTLLTGSASHAKRKSRTGRRIQYQNSKGQHIIYKRPKCKRVTKGQIHEFN